MSWSTQSQNDDFTTKVSGDYSKDGEERTDFLFSTEKLESMPMYP